MAQFTGGKNANDLSFFLVTVIYHKHRLMSETPQQVTTKQPGQRRTRLKHGQTCMWQLIAGVASSNRSSFSHCK